jgi:hypothetical protein
MLYGERFFPNMSVSNHHNNERKNEEVKPMNEKTDYKEDVERPIAVFETNLGSFEAELYAKECPETVWNFINLTEGRQQTNREGNFYDGLPRELEPAGLDINSKMNSFLH